MKNEELVMHLVKALEMALPEGTSVVVGGSAEPSNAELAKIIQGLAEKIANGTTCNCSCYFKNGSEEEDCSCEDCQDCERWENGECDGYTDECGNCPTFEEEEEETDYTPTDRENLIKMWKMLDEVREIAERAGLM